MHKKKPLPLLSLLLAAASISCAETLPPESADVPAIVVPAAPENSRYTTTQDMRIETRLTAFFLERAHILQKKIAELDMGELIDDDCLALDFTRSFFLQSDVDALKARFALTLSDHISRGNLHAAFTIYEKFLERLDERLAKIDERLRHPETFDLNRGDSLKLNRKDDVWLPDETAADEYWERRLTGDIITEILAAEDERRGNAESGESGGEGVPADAEKISSVAEPTPEAVSAACEKLRERNAKLRANLTLEPWEVEEIFLNALTALYDPHTSFLSKQSKEEFEIMMRNSLCGIGAVLYMNDGYCTVREIMPGSPVERSGKISVGDRIVAVDAGGNADGNGELTDVVGMRLNKIVRMLRGEKGVPVRILIESGNDRSRQVITLVRDEIRLTEQLASARVIDVPAGGETVPVGVVSLPSFYGKDRSDKTAFSASEDVGELLKKLKAENVKAVVLDLRRNGGGYLNEAIDLIELFVGPGVPALQTKGADGRPGKLYTGGAIGVAKSFFSSTPEWTGPVVVLVTKLSASASEIVAGALQDNRRALIVGDPQTHGKGSVQEVIPFKAYDSSQDASIKLTRSKWYSPSGNSIQIRGVSADVVAPSAYSVLPVGEGDLDRPLAWDSIPSVLDDSTPSWLSAPVSPELVEILAENSRRRQAELPEFLTHNRTIAWLSEREKEKTLPLGIRERVALNENDKAFRDFVKKEYVALSARNGYAERDVKLDSAIAQEKESEAAGGGNAKKKGSSARAANPAAIPGVSSSSADDEDEWPDYDVLLRESVRIAADWVELLERGNASAEESADAENEADVPAENAEESVPAPAAAE